MADAQGSQDMRAIIADYGKLVLSIDSLTALYKKCVRNANKAEPGSVLQNRWVDLANGVVEDLEVKVAQYEKDVDLILSDLKR